MGVMKWIIIIVAILLVYNYFSPNPLLGIDVKSWITPKTVEPIQNYTYRNQTNYTTNQTINNTHTTPSSTRNESDYLIVSFIDVGQGDAILIKYPNGKYMLIDGGSRYDGGPAVKNYLGNLNITEIDTVVMTHWDSDHIGGLINVFKNFKVDNCLYANNASCDTLTCEEVIKDMNLEGCNQIIASNGISYFMDDKVRTQILNPPMTLISGGDKNENSVVIKLTYDAESFLFTGDCESSCEQSMMSYQFNLRSDILKVAHHGSNTGTGQSFFNLVRPEVSVISVGKSNQYGHPSPIILDRLSDTQILRTDLLGTIVIETAGQNLTVVGG
jgi:competence protein ComEC